MRLRVLGCYGGALPGHRTTNFLVNDTTAVDAGALAFSLTFEEQCLVRDVFISHAHLDHTNSLPFLVDNVFGCISHTITVRSIAPVIESMKKHLFNNDTWPDFTAIPDEGSAYLRFEEIQPFETTEVAGVRYTPVPVNHVVPTVGYLIDDGDSSVIFTSDTGPCASVYEFANRVPNLKAVITEVSFPNELGEIAELSHHLTPDSFAREIAQLRQEVDVLLYHLKPPYIEQLHHEIAALGLGPRVSCIDQDRVYTY
jgi:cAMP phosphodiesterase